MMNPRLLGLALWQLVAVASATEPLACPLSLPPATLTMECSSVCPSSLSPCLYYAAAQDCVAEPEQDSGSVCVASTSEGDCGVECFVPFASDNWFFMITNGNEYKHDVSARKASDASFQLAKKSVEQLKTISDLSFPSTAKTISLSGNALPVVDKANAATVVQRGEYVTVNMESVAFLEKAEDATAIMIENINLKNLTAFPLLPKLTALHLANGGLTSVPTGIADLTALQRLDLSLNPLDTIPSGVLPTTLVDLCLQESGLKTMPADVASMTQLKNLNIGGNDFSDASAFASLPPSLEHFSLAGISLLSLPTSLSSLTNLRSLSLAGNSLDTVEKGTLPPSLALLNLSMNALSSIDEDAFPSTLETLDLRANRLMGTSLPPDLSTLSSLTALYLDDNKLDSIPEAVFTLPRLSELSLQRNPGLQMVTLSTTQLNSLSQLTRLTIDPRALVTSCNEPKTIGQTNFRVCVTGDKSIKATPPPDTKPQPRPGQDDDDDDDGVDHAKERARKAKDTRNKTWWLIIGVSSGVIGFVVLFIIGVLIVSRREALADTAAGRLLMSPPPSSSQPPDKGSSRHSDVSGGRATSVISDLSVIEHGDDHEASDATAYREMTSGAVAVTTMARGSSSSSYSSRSRGVSTVEGGAVVTSSTSTTTDGGVTVVKKVTKTTRTTTTTKGEAHTGSSSSSVVASASAHQTQVVERERFPSECEL